MCRRFSARGKLFASSTTFSASGSATPQQNKECLKISRTSLSAAKKNAGWMPAPLIRLYFQTIRSEGVNPPFFKLYIRLAMKKLKRIEGKRGLDKLFPKSGKAALELPTLSSRVKNHRSLANVATSSSARVLGAQLQSLPDLRRISHLSSREDGSTIHHAKGPSGGKRHRLPQALKSPDSVVKKDPRIA